MERVYAAVDIGNSFSAITKFQDVGSIVSVIVSNAFMFGGVIAFFLLVIAGFGMIQAAGSGDTKKMESGKQAITGAIIGLIIIIGSLWIIQILQVLTGLNGTGSNIKILPNLQ